MKNTAHKVLLLILAVSILAVNGACKKSSTPLEPTNPAGSEKKVLFSTTIETLDGQSWPIWYNIGLPYPLGSNPKKVLVAVEGIGFGDSVRHQDQESQPDRYVKSTEQPVKSTKQPMKLIVRNGPDSSSGIEVYFDTSFRIIPGIVEFTDILNTKGLASYLLKIQLRGGNLEGELQYILDQIITAVLSGK